jgi:hypothetical protein
MPADRQAFRDDDATARTSLAGERGIHRNHSLPSIRSFESEDGHERTPPRILDGLSEMMVLDHVADPQVFMVDRVILAHERERRLVVEVLSLVVDALMRLRQEGNSLAPTVTPMLATGRTTAEREPSQV